MDWADLPDLVLANIFKFLPTADRLGIGTVCKSWNSAVDRPDVWSTFDYSEKDIEEFGNALDFLKSVLFFSEQDIKEALTDLYVNAVQRFGRHFRQVNILYRGRNSSRVLHAISKHCHGVKILKVQRLLQNVQVVQNHDSSHRQALQNIIHKNNRMVVLEIRGADNYSVAQQKDQLPMGIMHSYTLRKLHLIQSFKASNLGNLMYLVNLRELAMEPHLLSYSLLYHLASRSLTELHIVAVSKHTEFYNENLQDWQWTEIKKQGPQLRVSCHFGVGQEWTEKEIILKKEMPLKCLKYIKFDLLKYTVLSDLICNYSGTLVEFVDFSVFDRSYEIAQGNGVDRQQINRCLYNIVASCRHLKLFTVKEVLFSQNILVMLSRNKHLKILLREDQVDFSVEFAGVVVPLEYSDLINASWRKKESFLAAVSEITGCAWHFFTASALHDTIIKHHLEFY